jgi:hypothetical protein
MQLDHIGADNAKLWSERAETHLTMPKVSLHPFQPEYFWNPPGHASAARKPVSHRAFVSPQGAGQFGHRATHRIVFEFHRIAISKIREAHFRFLQTKKGPGNISRPVEKIRWRTYENRNLF